MATKTALVAYASNSGNTRMVAEWIADALAPTYQVRVCDVTEVELVDFRADLLVLGTNSWLTDVGNGPEEGQLPTQWLHLAKELRNSSRWDGRRVAVFGCGRREYTNFCGGVDHLEQLVLDIGGQFVMQSLRLDGFPHHQEAEVREWATAVLSASRPVEVRPQIRPAPTTPNPGRRDPGLPGSAMHDARPGVESSAPHSQS